MGVIIPNGFGLAAMTLSGPVGTPDFITTIGIQLSEEDDALVETANKVFTAYADNFMPSTTTQLALTRVTLTVSAPGLGTGSVDSNLSQVEGEVTGEMAPISTAVILRKNTNVLGRQGRGRMFLPGIVRDSDVDINGRLNDAFVGATSNQGDQMLLDLLNDDYPGPLRAHLLHSTATVPTPIVTTTCSPVIGLLRYRIR